VREGQTEERVGYASTVCVTHSQTQHGNQDLIKQHQQTIRRKQSESKARRDEAHHALRAAALR
jgi:hypothetical protein